MLKDMIRCCYMKALPRNILANHPAYAKILHQYNELLVKKGKVNNKLFYEEVILPEIPHYSLQSWYQFLKRFKTQAGLIAAEVVDTSPAEIKLDGEGKVVASLLSNGQATISLLQSALNISAQAAKDILENPHLLSAKERMEIGLKAMKAQDSRMHAVGKLREDNREQERFDRAFNDASYSQ